DQKCRGAVGGGVRRLDATTLIDGNIDNHSPLFHCGNHLTGYQLGSRSTRDQYRTDKQICLSNGLSNGHGIRSERSNPSEKDVVQVSEPGKIVVQNGDLRAHSQGDFGCIYTDDASTDHDHLGWRNAWHTAQQNATSALIFFQVLGTDLHGHSSCYLTHGSQ